MGEDRFFLKENWIILDTFTDKEYKLQSLLDKEDIVELLNDVDVMNVKICDYIQRRLNETQNGGVKRFVNPAFVCEEGSGYISALLDIKKGLMKRGLWYTNVEELEYTKINTEGWK